MSKAKECINWIKDYFKDNPEGKAIIGISGGKDSTIAAALCVEALGADRVIGVLMPNGVQSDIGDSREVCDCLGIRKLEVDIYRAFNGICNQIDFNYGYTFGAIAHNDMIKTNLPARLRMATLYAVATLYSNSRVVNTCNYSEDYVGYSTKYGDAAGDFSPLGKLTVREVLEIGDELGLPKHLVHKAPSDGMCGKTDEDNLGFTYNELDDFILGTGHVSEETLDKIGRLHKATRHKYESMPTFNPHEVIIDLNELPTFDYSKQEGRNNE
jgi:NAD+ synthase